MTVENSEQDPAICDTMRIGMMDLLLSETAKVALLFGCFAAIYWVSRWASRLNESQPRVEPPPEPVAPPPPEAAEPFRKVIPIDQRMGFRSPEPLSEDELRPIRIVRMYFATFDFEPGPPDRSSFADELFVDLYNAESGFTWTESYFVATPQGLDEMLLREKWDFAYADRVFFVRRYDPKVVRQAVLEQLISTQEKPSPPKQPEDRYV
jgi:hypothetical protein